MATELLSKTDYKQVEVLGLQPTDRDPSDWLRMVARVFAAYKGVDVTKTIAAYIDGFHILNDINDIKNHNPGYYTFLIEKGGCFIDDQFIGFKDNLLVKFPQENFLPNTEYLLVLHYNWIMQADYPLAYFEVIHPDLFVEGEMLKIRGIKMTKDGEITLMPDDLNDQFANNFSKLLNLTSQKVMDSLDGTKFQYLVYDPDENKIDTSVKSGDFVFLDYITGTYKPSRSCTKRLDKAVALYLKDITNNKDYVIHGGYVNLGDPRWNIHPDRIYLKNLEPGSEYYLADNCIIKDSVNPYAEDTLNIDSVDPGKISTKFYPGLVRVGYAVEHDKMYIQLDYTSEIDVQNILTLFGDKERFDIRYQDYYRYYALLEQEDFYQKLISNENDNLTSLINLDNTLINDISTHDITFINNYNTYKSKKESLDKFITDYDEEVDFEDIQMKYSYNAQYNSLEKLYNEGLFKNIHDSILEYYNDLSDILSDIDATVTTYKLDNYDKSGSTNNTDGNYIKMRIDNFQADIGYIANRVSTLKNILYGDSNVSDSDLNISKLTPYFTVINDYRTKNINTTTFLNYSKSFYNIEVKNGKPTETGFLKNILDKLKGKITDLKTDFQDIIYDIFDKTNILNFVYSINLPTFTHTLVEVQNTYDATKSIFNYDELTTELSNDKYSLVEKTDFTNSSTSRTYSSNHSANSNISNYFKHQGFDKLLKKYEETIIIYMKITSQIKILQSLILSINNLYNYYSDTESSIDDVSTQYSDIDTNFESYSNKKEDLLTYFQKTIIEEIDIYSLNEEKDYIEKLLKNQNDLITNYQNNLITIQSDAENLKQALGTDLDFNIPTKSIFMISNYQRIIYNYTYITNRLKLKYQDQKVVKDRIEIAEKARSKVLSQVPVNKALDEQLKYIIASYNALLDEINNEIQTLTDEYNKIRNEYLGLGPIEVGDKNFDDGGYAIFDLDCLDSVE